MMISKHRVVVYLLEGRKDGQVFGSLDRGASKTEVKVDNAAWDEMGRPDYVTVTVEPGDLLNGLEGRWPLDC